MSPIISLSAEQRTEVLLPHNTASPIERIEFAATQFVRKLCIRSQLKGYPYLITAIVLGKRNPHLLSSLIVIRGC